MFTMQMDKYKIFTDSECQNSSYFVFKKVLVSK